MDWYEIKNWLELLTGLDRDSLHVYAGVGVQLIVALIFRHSLASSIPWIFVVTVALANEYYDYSYVPETLNDKKEYYDEAVRDIWNTLLLPSLFLVIARFCPSWITGKVKASGKTNKLEGANPPV